MMGPSESAREFVIVHRAQELDFSHGPTTRPRFQRDTQMLPHGDDLLDGATTATGKDGIGRTAETFKFGEGPRRATTAFRSGCSHIWHELFLPFILARRIVPAQIQNVCRLTPIKDRTAGGQFCSFRALRLPSSPQQGT
jgi:hypothetical protein